MEALKDTSHASVDSFIHAQQAKLTMNISPVAPLLAFLDWAINLANSPGKQYRIAEDFQKKLAIYRDFKLTCFLQVNLF